MPWHGLVPAHPKRFQAHNLPQCERSYDPLAPNRMTSIDTPDAVRPPEGPLGHVSPTTLGPTRLPFDMDCLDAIVGELGVPVTRAAYAVHGQPVFELSVPCNALPGSSLAVILWPSIRRVDVRLHVPGRNVALLAATAREVHTVEIYHGVEVMFRRAGGSVLLVTRDGASAIAD